MTMDTNPDHLDDETLSALFDDAAGSGGGADAAGHLAGCDRCAARQAELGAARAALAGAPVEPLDELARRRLVAVAVRAADDAPAVRPRWAQRHPAVIGSAAAAVLAVLVGVPFVLGNHDGASKQADKALSAQAPYAAPEAAGAFLGDLGDLTDRDQLRLRLTGAAGTNTLGNSAAGGAAPAEPGPSPAAAAAPSPPIAGATPTGGGLAGTGAANRAAGTPSSPAAAPSAAGTSGGPGTEKSAPAGSLTNGPAGGPRSFASDQAAARDRADADACIAALLDGPARGGRLTGSGVGTWRGRPAVVAALELSGSTVAFVTDRSGCAVLDRFTL